MAPPFRIGNGYDVHRLADGLELWLCGVRVAHSKGAVAHSDGDVAIHALCDALLGAAGLRDIGYHFPDTNAAYRGIDSKILLARTMRMVREKGYELGNVDIVLCLQRPKVKDLIPAMQQCLAQAMQTDVENVCVKATTTETLGFVGREEGVAAYAVSLLVKTNGSNHPN
ncbi:MAG: 2-C-methyl-D-erythritol 2,4-cyclodiphosphate synthase [Prevotellaceae bacterium]|jgi:2-C-methyl-D-erythritol 2,4-cyclodiphosphate synthase|nr:2-C-methyl-D-erythritol 2,4-cyclodiphosphate synthase [Prevotellaceae bacterium]